MSWNSLKEVKDTVVHVSGLDREVDESMIFNAFISFGEIVKVDLPTQARKFALIEYEDAADAEAAVENMHNSELLGSVIKARLAKTGEKTAILESQGAVWSRAQQS